MSIENEADLNEYMKTLLDFDNAQHKNFFLELVKKKSPSIGKFTIFEINFKYPKCKKKTTEEIIYHNIA